MSLASRQTPTQKKKIIYSDFLTSFDKHPITGDIAKLTNEEAVKQSIKMLVRTAYEEMPYEPNRGSAIGNMIFENSPLTGSMVEQTVRDCIRDHEQRAIVYDVNVNVYDDSNAIEVTILFGLINNTSQQYQIDLTLKRAR